MSSTSPEALRALHMCSGCLPTYLPLLLNSLACTLSQGQDLGQNRRRPDLLTGMLRRVQGMLQVRGRKLTAGS